MHTFLEAQVRNNHLPVWDVKITVYVCGMLNVQLGSRVRTRVCY
jgi:hypothetical protein